MIELYICLFLVIVLIVIFIKKKKSTFINKPSGSITMNLSSIDLQRIYKKALEQFLAKEYTNSILELDKIIEIYEIKNKESYDLRAMALEKLGYFLDAIDDFNESILLDKTDANIFFLRGMAKSFIGHYSESKKDIEIASKMKPENSLYSQNIELMETSPEVEKYAKEKAIKEGRLNRRVKFNSSKETPMAEKNDVKNGVKEVLDYLNGQLLNNPNNIELKERIKLNESIYKKLED